MPARNREIGPEVSRRAADWVLRERTARKWNRSQLSAELTLLGYRMSAATIRNIEKGITENGVTRDRLITLDEAAALGEVFGKTVITIPGD